MSNARDGLPRGWRLGAFVTLAALDTATAARFPDGARRNLTREPDVSQTPIRETLARREQNGPVIREALKGYRGPPLACSRYLKADGCHACARACIDAPRRHVGTRPNFWRNFWVRLESWTKSMEGADMKPANFR